MPGDRVSGVDLYVQDAPCTMNPLVFCHCILDQWDHTALTSPYWRWYWNDRSGASIRFNEQQIELTPGNVVLIPPNTPFGTHTARQVGHLYFHFWLSARVAAADARPMSLPLSRSNQALLRRLVRRLHRGRSWQNPQVSLTILSLAADALARANYAWDLQGGDALIDRIRHRLYAASSQRELDNAALAEECGVSVNTLLRRFRRATGTTPRQFLIQLRVERAAQLLRGGDMRIDDIAASCGFLDRYHFSRAFSALVGTSPAAFRNRNRWAEILPSPGDNERT